MLRHIKCNKHLVKQKYPTRRVTSRSIIRNLNAEVNALVYTETAPSTSRNGPLAHLSVAVKDNFCTSDMPTTCSSQMLRDFRSPFDATVVQLLRAVGADIVGKANCDEFGMGSLNVYSIHGPVINPHNAAERRSAGGSSGGSAAAVAAGLCDISLGTDTGGSIRLPASYCGIVGLKPSYGLISRWGVVSFADSLDCVGIMSRNVDVIQSTFGILSQYDAKDPSAAKPGTREKARDLCSDATQACIDRSQKNSLKGLRVGIPQEYFPSELQPNVSSSIRQVLDALQSQGAEVFSVTLPSTRYALSAYYVIASAEASSNMARYDGVEYGSRVDPPPGADTTKAANVYAHTRTAGFGKEVQRRILLGTYALTADAFDNYFLQAQRVRKLVRSDFDKVFSVPNVLSGDRVEANPEGVHVLLHPSAIRTAPSLEEDVAGKKNSLDDYVQDVLTVPASLAGLPALNVPAGLAEDGWPIGVSIVSQWGCDEMILEVGKAIEESLR